MSSRPNGTNIMTDIFGLTGTVANRSPRIEPSWFRETGIYIFRKNKKCGYQAEDYDLYNSLNCLDFEVGV